MHKLGDLMKELGFNTDRREETARAFIKNLLKSAYGVDITIPCVQEKPKQDPVQLTFQIEEDFVESKSARRKQGA